MNKQDFRLFQDLDDDMIDEISAKYLELSDDEIERMFAMIETKDKKQNINDEGNSVEVSGVDRYAGRKWYRCAAISASFVLMAGTVAGSIALMKNAKPDKNEKADSAATTQVAAVNKEEIDRDYIIDLCKNFKNSFDRIYVKYKEDDIFQKDESNRHEEGEFQYDKQNAFLWKELKMNYIDSTDSPTHCYYYSYDGREIILAPEEEYCEVSFADDTSEDCRFSYLTEVDRRYSWIVSDSNSKWSMTGYDTVCGIECAVIEIRDSSFDSEVFIDLKTGALMKEIADYDSSSTDSHNVFEVTEIKYDDEAGDFVTPTEFRKFVEDSGVSISYIYDQVNDRVDKDLSFLDAAPTTTAETTETGTPNTTESETETTQPAAQVPDNIDKDYIIKLTSDNMSSINRVYANVNHTITNGNEKQLDYTADLTIQYDKNKDCFCQFVNNESYNYCYPKEMMEYKDIIIATNLEPNHYSIMSVSSLISFLRDPLDETSTSHMCTNSTDMIRTFLDGRYLETSLGEYLAHKDRWSIIDRETVHGKDCAVIDYKGDESRVMYIDIKTGIVIKVDITCYDDPENTMIGTTTTFEITDIKLNDDAPEIVPSDFKKIIKDGGYEPANEERKDLSFLDE